MTAALLGVVTIFIGGIVIGLILGAMQNALKDKRSVERKEDHDE
jgi:hypothetical protein